MENMLASACAADQATQLATIWNYAKGSARKFKCLIVAGLSRKLKFSH